MGRRPAVAIMPVAVGLLALTSLISIPRLHGFQQKLSPFTEGTVGSGLDQFSMRSGDAEKRYIIEANSGGVCLFDFDNDGLVDVYLVNGGELESFRKRQPSSLRHGLFRNQGGRRFQDVTAKSGTGGKGWWGMGCSVVDYDGDGWLDLYVTNYGPNLLFRNRGNGRFEELGEEAGVAEARWSTGSTWGDLDGDGDLDLFVANYIQLDPDNLPEPGSPAYGAMGSARLGCQFLGLNVMCGPRGLPGAGDSLFVNLGNGKFEDASERWGVHDPAGYYGLGALWTDLNGDGFPELFVANDSTPNYLYQNHDGKRLEEIGLLSGVAVSEQGAEQAGMGVASGDYLNQGRLSLYVTHFSEEYNTLYRNDGGLNFTDATSRSGLLQPSLPYVGWGALFLDYDWDGWLDLFVSNGHVFPTADQVQNPQVAGYREKRQLYRNLGKGRFVEVTAEAGLGAEPAVGRGAAAADLDNDGALDIVVNNLDSGPTLLWGNPPPSGHYLAVQLSGRGPNRFAVGARVRIRVGDVWQEREVQSGGSYLSHGDFRSFFGLGRANSADEVEVRWPDQTVTSLKDVAADQVLKLNQTDTAPTIQ